MPSSNDSRRHPRIRVRVPNSLRIKVQDNDCLADLLDISQTGVGVEFFDLFDVIVFSEGDVVKLQFELKPNQVANKEASEILQKISAQKKTETSDSGEQTFETDAKIVWSYLNRLGLEFVFTD
jgi:hypothetical protein